MNIAKIINYKLKNQMQYILFQKETIGIKITIQLKKNFFKMLNMKNSKNLVINKLFKDGYCIIENFLNKHECRKIILEIENLKKKLSKNKKFKN